MRGTEMANGALPSKPRLSIPSSFSIGRTPLAMGAGLLVLGGVVLVLGTLFTQRGNIKSQLNDYIDNKIGGSGGGDSLAPDNETATSDNIDPGQTSPNVPPPQAAPPTAKPEERVTQFYGTATGPPAQALSAVGQRAADVYAQGIARGYTYSGLPSGSGTTRTVSKTNPNSPKPSYKGNPAAVVATNYRGTNGQTATQRYISELKTRGAAARSSSTTQTSPKTSTRGTRQTYSVPTHASTNSKATDARKSAEASRAATYSKGRYGF